MVGGGGGWLVGRMDAWMSCSFNPFAVTRCNVLSSCHHPFLVASRQHHHAAFTSHLLMLICRENVKRPLDSSPIIDSNVNNWCTLFHTASTDWCVRSEFDLIKLVGNVVCSNNKTRINHNLG